MTAIETVLEVLDGARKSGAGWSAKCRAHEDGRASLSISEGADGKVLLYCHAGCTFASIVAALGLEEGDLFPPKDTSGKRIVAEYSYTDETGAELFQAVRFEPKDFRQRHRVNGSAWEWNLNGARRVPYRLLDLIEGVKAGATVYVAEGEKDVDALRSLGLVATCNAGGAGKWRPEFSEYLTGARVVVIADKDPAGRKHAAAVEASLRGKAASVCVVEVPEGKDAADWIALGATREDFEELTTSKALAPARGVRLSEVLLEQYEADAWIIPNLLAVGALGILSADYGLGKSTLIAQGSACIASGRDFLGYPVARPVSCLYWQAEGSRRLFAGRLRDQCRHLGLDLDALPLSFQPRDLDPLPFDSPEFAAFVTGSGYGLVVCDTFGYFSDGDENSSKDWKQKVLKPLKSISRATGISFVLVHHEGKPNEFRKGRHKLRGSSAMGGDADTVLRLERLPGDPNGRILYFDKVKDAEEQPPLTLGFHKSEGLFTREGVAAEGSEGDQKKLSETKDRILSVLSRQPNLSGRQLYKLVLGSYPLFVAALRELQRDIEVIGEPGPRDSVLWKNALKTRVQPSATTSATGDGQRVQPPQPPLGGAVAVETVTLKRSSVTKPVSVAVETEADIIAARRNDYLSAKAAAGIV